MARLNAIVAARDPATLGPQPENLLLTDQLVRVFGIGVDALVPARRRAFARRWCRRAEPRKIDRHIGTPECLLQAIRKAYGFMVETQLTLKADWGLCDRHNSQTRVQHHLVDRTFTKWAHRSSFDSGQCASGHFSHKKVSD